MQSDFWHQRWQQNDIGFHLEDVNPVLIAQNARLNLHAGDAVFVPLCGRTHDIGWLLQQGYRVVAVELSRLAIDGLFASLKCTPEVTRVGDLQRHRAENLDVYEGDLFALSAAQLGSVQAIYDRAALVALPEEMRRDYAAHLNAITGCAAQLLISYTYDQATMPGPPFSVPEAEIRAHYSASHRITLLESTPVPGDLKGRTPALENVWLLQPLD